MTMLSSKSWRQMSITWAMLAEVPPPTTGLGELGGQAGCCPAQPDAVALHRGQAVLGAAGKACFHVCHDVPHPAVQEGSQVG